MLRTRALAVLATAAFAVVSVALLIALMLGWREAGVVAVAIPVTLALTLAAFYFLGFTLNRITLFALIFSIGILVDDAIVVVENIHRHMHLDTTQGGPPALAGSSSPLDPRSELGQSPRSLDAPGKIIVVDKDAKLLRTLSVPSPSMPNFAFGPGEKKLYVMAPDQIDAAPWHGKVYEVPNQ